MLSLVLSLTKDRQADTHDYNRLPCLTAMLFIHLGLFVTPKQFMKVMKHTNYTKSKRKIQSTKRVSEYLPHAAESLLLLLLLFFSFVQNVQILTGIQAECNASARHKAIVIGLVYICVPLYQTMIPRNGGTTRQRYRLLPVCYSAFRCGVYSNRMGVEYYQSNLKANRLL